MVVVGSRVDGGPVPLSFHPPSVRLSHGCDVPLLSLRSSCAVPIPSVPIPFLRLVDRTCSAMTSVEWDVRRRLTHRSRGPRPSHPPLGFRATKGREETLLGSLCPLSLSLEAHAGGKPKEGGVAKISWAWTRTQATWTGWKRVWCWDFPWKRKEEEPMDGQERKTRPVRIRSSAKWVVHRRG